MADVACEVNRSQEVIKAAAKAAQEGKMAPYFKDNKNYILIDGEKVDDIYHQCLHKTYRTKRNLSDIEAVDACLVKDLVK